MQPATATICRGTGPAIGLGGRLRDPGRISLRKGGSRLFPALGWKTTAARPRNDAVFPLHLPRNSSRGPSVDRSGRPSLTPQSGNLGFTGPACVNEAKSVRMMAEPGRRPPDFRRISRALRQAGGGIVAQTEPKPGNATMCRMPENWQSPQLSITWRRSLKPDPSNGVAPLFQHSSKCPGATCGPAGSPM